MSKIEHVIIIGAGQMGQDVARWFAERHIIVELTDVNSNKAASGIEKVFLEWDRMITRGEVDRPTGLKYKDFLIPKDLSKISQSPDMILEFINENLELKQKLFLSLDDKISKETIFATGTSTLSISSIAAELCEERKKRTIGVHFLNPAYKIPFIELIETAWTDTEILKELSLFFETQKSEVALSLDRPGFIVNRIDAFFYNESIQTLDKICNEEVKEIEDVLTKVAGFKKGPFKIMDEQGVAKKYILINSLWNSFLNNERYSPPLLLKMLIESNRSGKEQKQGFYKYE